LQSSVGYVHINLLSSGTQAKFEEAIAEFNKIGAKGLVIDLRDSPGGSVEVARAIAGSLIQGKTLSILNLPRGKRKVIKASPPKGGVWTKPIVVLVNAGTDGVSEVLAAAIRDGAGAKLVGAKTFGENLQQTLIKLRDGSAITMTTGKYLTPRGADYFGRGLTADISAPAGTKPGDDPQLAKALELLVQKQAGG
jgi:carboxyl-terminal processing protease